MKPAIYGVLFPGIYSDGILSIGVLHYAAQWKQGTRLSVFGIPIT
jgi:hypothetical protein